MTQLPAPENPYGDLFIYYCSGRLDSDRCFDDKSYIGNWEEGDFSFLFFTRPSDALVKEVINGLEDLELLDHYHMTYDEWHGDAIVPCRIGRFTVTPPWIPVNENTSDDRIVLDPGVVFGTGTHTTTRDCMEALQLAFHDGTIHTALDLGTGTGLLALAAARLGCSRVLATDITLLAARTAQRNITLNQLSDRVLAVQGDAEKFMDFTFDLVVSNIHYDVMKNLIRTKGFLKKKRFILSGLLRDEAASIESVLAELPVKIFRRWHQDGIWHTFYGACDHAG